MAQHASTITEYAVGADPVGNGWTLQWGAPTSIIVSGATPVGDRFWRIAGDSTGNNTSVTWNTPADHADHDILVLVRRTGAVGDSMPGVLARFQDLGDSGYAGVLRNDTTDVRIADVTGGSIASLAVAAHGISDTMDWVWIRLRVNGTALKIRAWAHGANEPGTWQIEITDSTYSSAGKAGVVKRMSLNTPTMEIAYFAVGTAGDSAPSPPPTGQVVNATSVLDAAGYTTHAGSSASADLLAALVSPRNDATYIRSALSPSTATFKCKLADLLSASGKFVRYTYGKLGGSQQINQVVQLRSPDGSSLVREWTHTNVGAFPQVANQDISDLTVSGEHQVWMVSNAP